MWGGVSRKEKHLMSQFIIDDGENDGALTGGSEQSERRNKWREMCSGLDTFYW